LLFCFLLFLFFGEVGGVGAVYHHRHYFEDACRPLGVDDWDDPDPDDPDEDDADDDKYDDDEADDEVAEDAPDPSPRLQLAS
jgi:hypothetical protein